MGGSAFVSVGLPLRAVGTSTFASRCATGLVPRPPARIRTSVACRGQRRVLLAHAAAEVRGKQSDETILPLACLAVMVNLANRILYKMQLVPMKEYVFLISQFVTVVYALVFGAILLIRKRKGIVTAEMLSFARKNLKTFAFIGLCEAISLSIGFYASARLPGTFISVLHQGGMLLFTMLASFVLLDKRFPPIQIAGVLVLLAGTATCVLGSGGVSALGPSSVVSESLLRNVAIFLTGMCFTAIAVTLKEKLFSNEVKLDIFVVNTAGSTAQAVATLLLMPLMLNFATPMSPGKYISQGLQAFAGANSPFMPWLGIAFVAVNIIFNILMLALLSKAGAVTSLVTNLAAIPLTSLVFCLPLPLLGRTAFGLHLVAGLGLILAGVLLYNKESITQAAKDARK